MELPLPVMYYMKRKRFHSIRLLFGITILRFKTQRGSIQLLLIECVTQMLICFARSEKSLVAYRKGGWLYVQCIALVGRYRLFANQICLESNIESNIFKQQLIKYRNQMFSEQSLPKKEVLHLNFIWIITISIIEQTKLIRKKKMFFCFTTNIHSNTIHYNLAWFEPHIRRALESGAQHKLPPKRINTSTSGYALLESDNKIHAIVACANSTFEYQ